MGVHGLWTLLEPVGKPVPLESLENKVLAVDVSIWLHQATKGFRDSHGNPLPNAHLLGLCHRLCKLLFYKIKPVFVFDGGVPVLKRQTIAARQSRRFNNIKNNNKLSEKILANYIKSEVINKELGKGKGKALLPKRKQEPDLFELPPQPLNNLQEPDSESETSDEFEDFEDASSIASHLKGHNIHSVDVTSAEFLSLPAEVQHEILLELKETRKQSSWSRMNLMPQEAKEFSGFQIERLLKRRNLQRRLNEVEKEISRKKHESFEIDIEGEIESKRIMSDNTTQYVLIKKALERKEPPKLATQTEKNDVEFVNKEGPLLTTLSDDEDLTQEEILAIVKIESSAVKEVEHDTVIQCFSTSEDDSDFEEVSTSPQPQVILAVPINPEELDSDEDMFADVFGKPAAADLPSRSPPRVAAVQENATISDDDVSIVGEPQSPLAVADHREEMSIVGSHKKLEEDALEALTVQVTGSTETIECEKVFKMSAPQEPKETTATADIVLMEPPSVVQQSKSSQKVSFTPMKEPTTEVLLIDLDRKDEGKSLTTIVVEGEEELQVTSIRNEETRQQPGQRVEKPPHLPQVLDEAYQKRLEEMDRALYKEQVALVQERGRQERLAATLTDQIIAESQEMLQHFGIPFLVAPMEAEAQCAYLDEAGITQGTITDDSDIWLFGGRRVYKNFFNQGKYVEYFEADDLFKVFKMKRQQLISLALLTGSDYTEGLQGVGPVCALEILAEFPGEGLEQLENFKEWLARMQKAKNAPPGNKIREKLRNLQLSPGFPSRAVVAAYENPEVNKSREKFSWKEPDLESLRDYLQEKIGWNREKFSSVVLPVLERFKNKEYQTKIDSFFAPKFSNAPKSMNMSKRVLEAIRRADFQSSQENGETSVETSYIAEKAAAETKKRRSNGTSAGAKRSKKVATVKTTESSSQSSSGSSNQAGEKIWQREKDRQTLATNKLKAIEILKRSRGGRGKRLPRPAPLPEARLSDSDSSSS